MSISAREKLLAIDCALSSWGMDREMWSMPLFMETDCHSRRARQLKNGARSYSDEAELCVTLMAVLRRDRPTSDASGALKTSRIP